MTPGMSWPCAMRPQPIWPTRMRLFAPHAREAMISGATAAVTRTSRRETPAFSFFMAIESIQTGRGAEYKRAQIQTPLDQSLVAQRLDGIEPRCLARRIQPEQNPHARADRKRRHDDLGARDHRPAELARQQIPAADAKQDTQRPADGRQHQCL